jgi:glycosyltransferase involved in cell wall biosynthesis
MRLCWIKAGGFVPLDFGGRIRSFQMVKELACRHAVTVLTFYPAIQNDPHAALAPLFEELITVPLRLPNQRSVGEYLDYLRLLPAPHPYSMQKYYRPKLRRVVAELFSRKSFDAIICDFIYPAGVLDWTMETPIILFTHNVEAEVWERQYRVSRNPIRKLMFWIEYQRLTHSERYYAERAARVCAVSESNRRFFGRYVGGAEYVSLIPTGVDTDYFRPSPEASRERTLVFTGSLDWVPNHDAVDYFYREVLPLIRAEEPDVETWIVGRNPPPALRRLVKSDPKVHLTGRVEDVRPFMDQSSIYILPMRTGSGTRLKIFEAMASGKAIVSTPIGAEGLPVTDGENILLSEDSVKFAKAVIRLIRDVALRRHLEKRARALAESGFSWRAATHRLEEAIVGTVGESANLILEAN